MAKSISEKVFEAIQTALGTKYPLTSVYINGNIAYYMNPTVQKSWEEFTGLLPRPHKEY